MKMSGKKIRRIACTVLLAGVAAAASMFTGCNTDHPEAKITIEYYGETYVLKYKMYRNMYPQTVQHFIELADSGFYDNTIVHDYLSTTWQCGGYNYLENDEWSYETALAGDDADVLDYMEAASKELEYKQLADPEAGVITPSVYLNYTDGDGYSQPLNTLIGEFSNNQHKIESGALTESFGSLRMYYTDKGTDAIKKQPVYLDKKGSAAGVRAEYGYNCATSLFVIQSGTSTSTNSSYAIFATLKNESVLTDLKTEVSNHYGVQSIKMYVDNYDYFAGSSAVEKSYNVPKVPIVIKSVEITKY